MKRIENSIEAFEKLRRDVTILKRAAQEEATDYSRPKVLRTTKFLVDFDKYNDKILQLIDAELEILELEKNYYSRSAFINR